MNYIKTCPFCKKTLSVRYVSLSNGDTGYTCSHCGFFLNEELASSTFNEEEVKQKAKEFIKKRMTKENITEENPETPVFSKSSVEKMLYDFYDSVSADEKFHINFVEPK